MMAVGVELLRRLMGMFIATVQAHTSRPGGRPAELGGTDWPIKIKRKGKDSRRIEGNICE